MVRFFYIFQEGFFRGLFCCLLYILRSSLSQMIYLRICCTIAVHLKEVYRLTGVLFIMLHGAY